MIAEDHAVRMGENLPDQHSLLAGCCEFRPVAGDRRIKIDCAPIDEHVRAQRAHAFGHGIHDDDGVRPPWIRAGEILVPLRL
jgi:hypothetical protein